MYRVVNLKSAMRVSIDTLLQASAPNYTPVLLSVAFFISAGLDFTLSGFNSLSAILVVIAEIAAGTIALLYSIFTPPGDVKGARPLGVTLLGLENVVAGAFGGFAGIALLFLPIIGIVGVIVIAIGVGLAYLGRALLNGAEWAALVQIVIAFVGIIVGFVGLALHSGNPVLPIFQLWYLRRPYVQEFFHIPYQSTLGSGRENKFGLALEKTCMACGALDPNANMYCSNCGIRIFSSADGVPFAGAVENERIVRLKLEIVREELRKMDKIRQEGKIVDPIIFQKAYSERDYESRRLKANLERITATTSAL
jgi:hypothetical protein